MNAKLNPEILFAHMKDDVESILNTRVKLRCLWETLGDMARDASGIVPFKDNYEDPEIRSVEKELYALDHTLGESFRSIERLERHLKAKVKV